MLTEQSSLEYYNLNSDKIHAHIDSPMWRIWKVESFDGIIRQNKRQISTKTNLKYFLSSRPPNKLYVSVSTFLNPHKNKGNFINQKKYYKHHYFYSKSGYLIADNILISSDYFIDLDSETDLRIAQQDARKILKNIKLEFKYAQFSGTKGIHLFFNHSKITEPDPTKRIQKYIEEKKQVTNQLLKLNLKCIDKHHAAIMCDVYRVYAAPYSIKPNGNVVTPISKEDLMTKDIYTILNRRGITIKPREPEGNDKKVATVEESPSTTTVSERGKRAGLSSSFLFIDNKVKGTKNYVICLKLKKERYNQYLINQVMLDHNIPELYLYEHDGYYYGLCFKLVQYSRLVKIMRRAKSDNYRWFVTRGFVPIPISNIKKVCHFVNLPYYQYWHSRAHSEFFKQEYNKMTGDASTIGTMTVTT